MYHRLRDIIEINAFGVCSYLGDKLNVASSKIRMYFIYLSFLTFGSPVIIYLFIAFWMNIKDYIFIGRRNPFWYK